jgi:hypothetical protein
MTLAKGFPNVEIKPENATEPLDHSEIVSATGVPLLTPVIEVTEAAKSGRTEAT